MNSKHLISGLALLFGGVLAAEAADQARAFGTPEEAVKALSLAASARDDAALQAIFGPDYDQIKDPYPAQAARDLVLFDTAILQTNRITRRSDTSCFIEIGTNYWPFPVPLVKQGGQWHFDALAGREEMLNRRIGDNELFTLQVVRTYAEAQREYASRLHDDSEVQVFAQKLVSSPGKHDGLYWPPEGSGQLSPLGPGVACAQPEIEGGDTNAVAQPFHGYYYKILTRQGKHAPGGKYDYITKGKMIGGFALAAYPAYYGQTGIMTFIVNQQGRVYQKDLGSKTDSIGAKMKEFDPDSTWQPSKD
jgi:hypothetical protein